MTPVITDAEYAVRFEFRPRGPHEKPDAYHRKLIAHVSGRDLSAAHELRVGRVRADWTREDVEAFVTAAREPRQPPREDVRGSVLLLPELGERFEPTEAMLLTLCDRALDAVRGMRVDEPQRSLLIFATVLLTNGTPVSAVIADRGDRVAALRQMAQHLPVFGFILITDNYVHGINREAGTTTRTDAIIAHVGTRDCRIIRVRPYHYDVGGVVVFDPPPPDIDPRRDPQWHLSEDAYAGIFVSVPPPTGAPS